MSNPLGHSEDRGAVAVVVRSGRLLLIRRSRFVVAAPRAFCFPGGAVEPGDDESEGTGGARDD